MKPRGRALHQARQGDEVKFTHWLLAAAATGVLAPTTASAQAPLTAGYTATDISTTNHQWYVTGTTTTVSTIATRGTVTFNYVTGNPATTTHDVLFAGTARPTECAPALNAQAATPAA